MSFFFSAAIPQPERTRSICLHCYRRLSRPQNFRKDFGGQKGLISCDSTSRRRYSNTTDSDSRQTHYEETVEKQAAEHRNSKFNSSSIRRIINTLTSVGSSFSTSPADFLPTKASLTSGLNRLNVATPIPHSTKFLSPQSKLTSRSLHKTNLKEHYVYYISQGDYGRALEILKKLRAESDFMGSQRSGQWNQEVCKSGSKKGTNKGKRDEWKDFEVQMVIERLGRDNSIERIMCLLMVSRVLKSCRAFPRQLYPPRIILSIFCPN
ncbi:hypothetical protein BKA69DRAFT_508241 [Paraphysoderma sedebokerense]|nr:hypothetical protein BKA69DRAFT_508241 [Paraphysoderma sedebokerense]